MKQFFSDHSYNMVKMFLNQFAIAVFGFVLVLAAGKAQNVALRNITSVCAILFYLFLLYTMTWDIGFHDRISVEHGKKTKNGFRGALISLCANVPNLVFAVFVMLASLFNSPTLSNIGGWCSTLALFLEGMYTGLLVNPVGGAPLNSYWFVYFLLPLPAILTCGIAYNMGIRDVKLTKFFRQPYPESDRDPKEKK